MAKIDLTSYEWTELIFLGKNKEYGAYQLRNNSGKRHNLSILIVIAGLVVIMFIPKLIEMAKPKHKEVMTEVTTLSQLKQAEVHNDVKKATAVTPPPALKTTVKFTAPIIKKDEEVSDNEEIKSQEELTNAKGSISIADVKGNDEEHGADIADIKENVTQDKTEDVPYTIIEQMPVYPGGEAELLAYISKTIKYPVIAQENGIEGKVILRFVVSKTGKISNVEVLRSLDAACDREAVRVVKTLQDWIPGKQNGVNVAVYYTLPITFKLQQ